MDDDERRASGEDQPSDGQSPPEPPAFTGPPIDEPPTGPPRTPEPPYTFDAPRDMPSYGPPPYGPGSYGTPAYGPQSGGVPYSVGPPGGDGRTAEAASRRTQAIVSLVLNLLALVSCCNLLGIAGAVCAGSALSKVDVDPGRAASLLRWSWGLLVGGFVLAVLGLVAVLAVGGFGAAVAPLNR